MSFAKLAGENPFLLWVLKLHSVKGLEIKQGAGGTKDIILDASGSRRFGLGVYETIPYLGYVDTDREALESVRWSTAAILLGKQGKDWVALSCKDARPEDSQAMNPVPIRLFVEVSVGRLAAWKDANPTELALGTVSRNAKGEPVFADSPLRKVPLRVG
jgi:hypothetical protein